MMDCPRHGQGCALKGDYPDGKAFACGTFVPRAASVATLPPPEAPPSNGTAHGLEAAAHPAGIIRLSDVEPERVRWLWPGRLPLGKLAILDGDPDLGKSTVTLDVAARISTGRAMPDGSRSELDGPAGVVILSAEDDPADTIRPRLNAAGADVSRIVALRFVVEVQVELRGEQRVERRTPRLPTLADLENIAEAIRMVGAKLVIIDPLMAFLPKDVKAISDQDVRGVLARLSLLAQESGACMWVVRHLNKSGGTNAKYRGGASIGIIGAARSGLLVAEDPDDSSRRILAVVKCNLAVKADSLAYRLESAENAVARVAWEGSTDHTANTLLSAASADSDEQGPLDEACRFLREVLGEGDRLAKEVMVEARASGVSDRTLHRARARLSVDAKRYGFGKDGKWWWRLPTRSIDCQTDQRLPTESRDCQESEREPTRQSMAIYDDGEVL